MNRRKWAVFTLSLLVCVCVSAAMVLALRQGAINRILVGSWTVTPGGESGRHLVRTFLPNGTVSEAYEVEGSGMAGGCLYWNWWTRGDVMFLRAYTPPPVGQGRVTRLLNTAFDEFYRHTSRRPQNDEISYRITELTPQHMVLEELNLNGREPRRHVYERFK